MKIKLYKFIILFFFLVKLVILFFFYFNSNYHKGKESYYKGINIDEYSYHQNVVIINKAVKEKGFNYVIKNFWNYTHSYHVGNYVFLTVLLNIFNNNIFLVLLIKLVIFHFIGLLFFYKFVHRFYHNEKLANIMLIFLGIYMPLNYYNYSIMRDDLIFTLIVIINYLVLKFSDTNQFKLLIISIFFTIILASFRIHASIFIITLGFAIFLKRKNINMFFSFKKIVLFTIIIFLIFYIFPYVISTTAELLLNFNIVHIAKQFVRLIFSPLPWQLDSDQFAILIPWYLVSLIFLIISPILFPYNIINSIIANFYMLIAVLFVYIFPYMLEDTMGLRQTTIVIPFLTLFIYSYVLKKINLKTFKIN